MFVHMILMSIKTKQEYGIYKGQENCENVQYFTWKLVYLVSSIL